MTSPHHFSRQLADADLREVDWFSPVEAQRFFERIGDRQPNECWRWRGAGAMTDGYGMVWSSTLKRPLLAHRVACVNPEHLRLVTSRENTLSGRGVAARNAAKTHCPHGHPYDAENTIRTKTGRACKACRRLRRARKAAA